MAGGGGGGVAGGGGGAAALQLGHGGQLGAGARPPSGGVSRLPAVPRLGMVTGDQLAVEGVEMAMGLAKRSLLDLSKSNKHTSTSNPFLCAADFFLLLGSCKEAVR